MPNPRLKFYAYDKCSTCIKARKWLEAAGLSFENIPIVQSPPSRTELETYWRKSGLPLRKFFNTSGQSYRALGLGERIATMSESEQLDLLANDGKLIKRPLLIAPHAVLVGFDAVQYQALAH